MNIDYFSDYNCPFCYIGITNLRTAANELDLPLEVSMHSFELNPDAPAKSNASTLDRFSKKYNLTTEEASKRIESINKQAKDAGLNMDYFNAKSTNSFNAHRLTKFAKTLGLENELAEELYKAYFIDLKELADIETLVEAAINVGMDENQVREFLSSDKFANEVRIDEDVARANLIQAVPYFIIDQKYVIPGALAKDDMKDVLERISEGRI